MSACDWAALSTERPSRFCVLRPTSSGTIVYSLMAPSLSSATNEVPDRLSSSKPSAACTTMTCSLPRASNTSAMGRQSLASKTPITWRLAPAGLVIGPNILNTVRMASSLRGPMACFIALWCAGANIKPTPISSTARATCSGDRLSLTPAASNTSALPVELETERLPCLATLPPQAATTNAAAVETLNKLAPSPPVPQVSTIFSALMTTGVAKSRITCAAPVISSTVSPFMRKATKKAPICASLAAPVISCCITAVICSRLRSSLFTKVAMACWIFTKLPLFIVRPLHESHFSFMQR